MKSFHLPLIATFLFLQGVSLVHAQPAHREGFGSGRSKAELIELLHLTPEQIEKLSCDTPFQGKELMKALYREKEALDALLKDKKKAKSDIYQQFDRVQKALRDFHSHRLEKILQIREILTPEQLNDFMKLKEDALSDFKMKQKVQ
ncbi:MAG: hypothetical protein KDD55_08780 [Bdellovibrionales bacterium]|nr:hypothetical protein [Bdellovibrionales bacterium]